MKNITIDTNKGPAVIPAYIHGKFAVHLPYYPQQNFEDSDPEHYFHITHIATGLHITGIYGRPSARKFAKQLDEATPSDITKEDYVARNEAWKAFAAAVAALVKRDTQPGAEGGHHDQ